LLNFTGEFLTKFIIVTGGVLSGLGKGILTASIGKLISGSYHCTAMKLDGYLNVDPGTMNPVEHGEVFVLDDGTEVDMDFGHYERFMDVFAKGEWNITMGRVFKSIHDKERKGEFLGKTVQFIPHVTDEIKEMIYSVARKERAQVMLIEIGGTVGDMENTYYLEALRQLANEVGRENSMFIHLSYVPVPRGVDEQKSKPTQMSVKELNRIGIWPDMVVCRCKEMLTDKIRSKISSFCSVEKGAVLTGIDVDSVYLIPGVLYEQGITNVIENKLKMKIKNGFSKWDKLAKKMVDTKCGSRCLTIGICGKYTVLEDSYASIVEAIKHSAANLDVSVKTEFVDTQRIEKGEEAKNVLKGLDGIIIPGGFGDRGWEGKISVAEYARKKKLPFLGICLGFQAAVVEYARNVAGLEADSTEMNSKVKDKVITLMDEQKNIADLGGTMRLGKYEAILEKGSIISKLYNSNKVFERHRHRYEVNPEYHKLFRETGLIISGFSPDGKLAEFLEIPSHPYYVATQAHPELKSKLEEPAPLFYGLIKAAKEKRGFK
jgi:CTP synthase